MLLFEVMSDQQQVMDAFFEFEAALNKYRALQKQAGDSCLYHIEVRELLNYIVGTANKGANSALSTNLSLLPIVCNELSISN